MDHSLMNKSSISFFNIDFEKRTKRTILDFNQELEEYVKNFKGTIMEPLQTLPDTYCAYIPTKALQLVKAKGMIQTCPLISTMLVDNNVELNGRPFLEVTQWNRELDSIAYNFCYPIIKRDSLPQNNLIKYKQFKCKGF